MMFFLTKITTVLKYNSILSICRRSWSPFRRYSVAPLPHSVAPFRHFAAYPHFDAPYPHISSHHSHHILPHHIRTFWRTKPAHFVASYPHISSHHTTWHSCKTGFSYETKFNCETEYSLQNKGFSCERGFSCKAGVKAKNIRSRLVVGPRCWRPQLYDGFVSRVDLKWFV